MRVVKIYLSALCCLFFLTRVSPIPKGSDTLVSIEPFFSFPSSDSDNQALTFGFFRSGLGLQDRTTTCTFKSVFPVSGDINLNGGQLYLTNDFVVQDFASLNSGGFIIGNNHSVELSGTITGIPAVYNSVFKDTKLFLNSDIVLSGTVRFKGNCILDGRWNRVTLADTANIVVGRGSTLSLRNIEIEQIKRNNIRCLDNGGSIILDNMLWEQDSDFTFTNGSFKFVNNVVFTGPWKFIYTSNLTSTIDQDSSWMLSDLAQITIGRQGSVFGREPLFFTDFTSSLVTKNNTFNVSSNGMRITRGSFVVDGEVIFDINSTGSTNGLAFGDATLPGDMKFRFTPASVVNLKRGDLVRDVVAIGNFVTDDTQKIFVRQGVGANFWSNFDSYFVNVDLRFAPGGISFLAPGKKGYFNSCHVEIPSFGLEFAVTATRINDFVFLLNNGGRIDVTAGSFITPLGVTVLGTSNVFTAAADVSANITLRNPASGLLLGIHGNLLSNVTMNGGTVTLGSDLKCDKNVILTGTGNLVLGANNLILGTQDTVWTSSILFSSSGSQIALRSLLSLGSTVTFNGICTIDGNGNELHLSSQGNIVVGKNSTLAFKNISLTGIKNNNIRCFDNSSKIILNGVDWQQDANYGFTIGSLEIKNENHFSAGFRPFVFAYQTTQTALIDHRSSIIFDQAFTFSYDPINKNKTGIKFVDQTSALSLDGATLYITTGGMQLKGGNLGSISNASKLSMEGSIGLIIGNNVSSDDCAVHLAAGGLLDVLQGILVYQNVIPSSWHAVNVNSILRMESGTTLQLDQPLNLDAGRLLLHVNSNLFEATPSSITGIVEVFE